MGANKICKNVEGVLCLKSSHNFRINGTGAYSKYFVYGNTIRSAFLIDGPHIAKIAIESLDAEVEH